jgi:gamma-glutamyltranspeptidase/glutathione hydrolase
MYPRHNEGMTFTTRPELVGTFGMAASTHPIATAAGMAVLEEGGTAFDAAVAMGLTLQVVQPHLCGLGGDVPIIGFDAASNSSWVLCGQGVSPAAATPEHFAELGLEIVPGTGQLPAVVPGAFGAWMTLLERHGTLPLRSIMRFAIDAARVGFALPPRAAATIATLESTFRDHWTSSAEVYLQGGSAPAARERFTNPQLADTLERLLAEAEAAGSTTAAQAEGARRAFYEGFVAEAIDAFAATPVRDSSGRDHRGLLTGDDLAAWRATFEEPARVTFRGHEVLKTQAWGQGPVLLQQLAILDGLDLETAAPGSADLIHLVVEAAKLAFADREAYYGDVPDVPMDALLSPAYAAKRRALITDSAASGLHPGSPDGRTPVLPDVVLGDRGIQQPDSAGVGEPTITKGDTVHLDVVDRWGNVLSATPSGAWLQSSPVIPGLGLSLPTRGQMFWLQQGLPNSLAPRKRPRTTLSPGMLLRDGRPALSFGTPGGDGQDQWPVQFLVNHLVHGLGLQAAIEVPQWSTNHFPSSFAPRDSHDREVELEVRAGAEVKAELERRGHLIVDVPEWHLGRITAAGIRADGMLHAASDPRGMECWAAGR